MSYNRNIQVVSSYSFGSDNENSAKKSDTKKSIDNSLMAKAKSIKS